MQILFSWDSELSRTVATFQSVKTEADIERLLSKGVPKNGLRNNLALNARLDSLDAVESEWWSVQRQYQKTPKPELESMRAELESANTWLAGYRGEPADPRPDVSGAVLERIKGFAQRWYESKARERHGNEVTESGKTIALTPENRTVIQDAAVSLAVGNTYATIKLMGTDGSAKTFSSETQFKSLVQKVADESRTANSWLFGNVTTINAATDVDEVLAVLA